MRALSPDSRRARLCTARRAGPSPRFRRRGGARGLRHRRAGAPAAAARARALRTHLTCPVACCPTRAQLKQLLAGPAAARPSVVDLREAEELAAAKLPSGVTHLPLRRGASLRRHHLRGPSKLTRVRARAAKPRSGCRTWAPPSTSRAPPSCVCAPLLRRIVRGAHPHSTLQVICQHGRARSVAGAAKLRGAGVADVKARPAHPARVFASAADTWRRCADFGGRHRGLLRRGPQRAQIRQVHAQL